MKTTISIAIIFLMSLSSQAQTLIPKVGISLSALGASEHVPMMSNSFSGQSGYSIGVGYSIPVKPNGGSLFSIQPEISFVQKGFKVDAQGEFIFIEQLSLIKTHQEYTINYLEFPVLAKYELGPDNFRFSFYAGPSIAFGLGGKYKVVATQTAQDVTEQFINTEGSIKFYKSKNENDINFDHNVDFGLQVGVGVTFFKKVMVEARYGNGLTNLNEEKESKNRVVQFTLGMPIALR
jgi:hypothetical protein